MEEILKAYNKIRYGKSLTADEVKKIESSEDIKDFQLASLVVQLYYKKRNDVEDRLYVNLREKETTDFIPLIEKDLQDSFTNTLLFNTAHNIPLGKALIDKLIKAYVDDKLDLKLLATWLMLVTINGLSYQDVKYLTLALMGNSTITDYRQFFNDETFFMRRYPTGGVSEKTALILPSLLAATAKYYPIKSNFLVAKSLGYTGGTVDKLSSLSGFHAPTEETHIVNILSTLGVVMSSTNKEIAYADKKLYSFRSLTGTVESLPLIVSSIGSKQLCIPSDYLLMDVRYGKGAFIKNRTDATKLGDYLNKILRTGLDSADYLLTLADTPNGQSIGNIVEVIEATDIIQNKYKNSLFNAQGMHEQLKIVLKFYENMMNEYSPQKEGYWKQFGQKLFEKGEVQEKFYELLSLHGVDNRIINILRKDAHNLLKDKNVYTLSATEDGKIGKVEYDNIGYFVNYKINYDELSGLKALSNGGIVIKILPGIKVKSGDILMTVYSSKPLTKEQLGELKQYIHMEAND